MSLLQPEELSLLQNASLLPAKHQLLGKLEKELVHTYEVLREYHQKRGLLQEDLFHQHGKISKGDNYQFQAYRVLDYPRIFVKKDQFAFRSMILWGHEISFHFILSGKYLAQFQAKLRGYDWPSGFWLAAHDTPWTWERSADHWLPLSEFQIADWEVALQTRAFLKISTFSPLAQLDQLSDLALQTWSILLEALGWPKESYPGPGKDQAE